MTTQQGNNNLHVPLLEDVKYKCMARPKKIHVDPDQPQWICYKCGIKYGSFKAGQARWHTDVCGCCGETQACTEPINFGYLLLGWKSQRDDDDKRDLDGKYDDEA